MTFESSLFLALSIAALFVFAVTVAYGQWVTRNVKDDGAPVVAKPKAANRPVGAPVHRGAHA